MRPFQPMVPLPPGITLIEASAGTGKTYNLTNLCLRLVVEQRLPIEQILLVTFTRAATAELRERLRLRFTQAALAFAGAAAGEPPDEPVQRALAWADGPHPDLAERTRAVEQALRSVDVAPVFTIHGFCQRVLREHAFECGADLTAELLENTSDLLSEAVDDEHIDRHHRATALEFALLTQTCSLSHREPSGMGASNLTGLARSVTSARQAPIDPEQDPVQAPGDLVQTLADRWRTHAHDMLAHLRQAIGAKIVSGRSYQERWNIKHSQAIEAWLAEPSTPPPARPFEYFGDRAVQAKLNKGKSYTPHPLQLELDALIDAWTELADRTCANIGRSLRSRFERALDRDGVISFDSLIHQVADQIDRPELLAALRARYRAALIDEFQDTDTDQWRIFSHVFGGSPDHRLVLVGDPKQAIYGFRGADVRVYGDAKEHTGADHRYTMTTNYRSDGAYVDALNRLFDTSADAFSEDFIRYEPVDVPPAHRGARAELPSERVPLELRWIDDGHLGGTEGEQGKRGEARKALPELVSDEVQALLAEGVRIPHGDAHRTLAPGDLAVLVRTNDDASAIRDALLRRRVPAVVQQGEAVTRSLAAGWVRDWLGLMASPQADAPLRRFATGPLGGWSVVALHGALHQEQPELQARWASLCALAQEQAKTYTLRGFLAAWQRLLSDPELRPLDRIAQAPRGERALADLAHLAELLHSASAQHRDPDALGAWLDSRAEQDDLDADIAAQRLETDALAVQVLTIHRSKGLQYPVVLLPDLWRAQALRPEAKRATRYDPSRLDPSQPSSLRLDLSVDAKASPKAERLELAHLDMLREGVRLAYVALTRAEHAAVVWGATVDKTGTSPLAALLAPHAPGATEEQAIVQAQVFDQAPRTLATIAQSLAEGEGIGFSRCAPPPAAAAHRADSAPPEPEPASYPQTSFPRGWRRLSFTALTRQAHGGAVAVTDYDEVDQPDIPDEPDRPAPLRPDDQVALASFPRGREAGIFVHGVLEHLDFTTGEPRPSAGAATVEELLQQGARKLGLDDAPALLTLERALPQILDTPLGGAFGSVALRSIPLSDRLDELEFDLPVCGGYGWRPGSSGITGRALAHVLRDAVPDLPGGGYGAWLEQLARLQPESVAGFLTGSIDLVARVHTADGPRWLVADYKTNRLSSPTPDDPYGSSTAADYTPERMAQSMAEHHYLLQASLYLVGLHRYLRHRLGGAYDLERDVLGAAYLFVRGMGGAPGAGVFGFTPSARAIEALSDLLDRGAA